MTQTPGLWQWGCRCGAVVATGVVVLTAAHARAGEGLAVRAVSPRAGLIVTDSEKGFIRAAASAS